MKNLEGKNEIKIIKKNNIFHGKLTFLYSHFTMFYLSYSYQTFAWFSSTHFSNPPFFYEPNTIIPLIHMR